MGTDAQRRAGRLASWIQGVGEVGLKGKQRASGWTVENLETH